MIKKKAKATTIATQKYHNKAGYISKSYKLKKDVIESFKLACDHVGISQSSQLTKLMQEFIETTNLNNKERK